MVRMRYTDPFEEVVNESINYWKSEGETFERICKVIFSISEYTIHTEIAEAADCSPNSVKKHLDRLTELRLVEKASGTKVARYRLNSSYIEWRALRYIIDEYSMEEIIERVEALEARQDSLVDKTGEIPTIVPAADVKMHESVGSRMEAANELELIKRRIRLYELARQAIENDGHLVSSEL